MCSSQCELSEYESEKVSALSLVIDVKNNEIKRRSSGFKRTKSEEKQSENDEEDSESLTKKCKGIESIADKLKNKNENNNSQIGVRDKSTRILDTSLNVKTEDHQPFLKDSIDHLKPTKHQQSRSNKMCKKEFTKNNFRKSNSYTKVNKKRDSKKLSPTTSLNAVSKKSRVQASKSLDTSFQNQLIQKNVECINQQQKQKRNSDEILKNSISLEGSKTSYSNENQSSMRMMELRPMPKNFIPYNREKFEKVNYVYSRSDGYNSQCDVGQPSLKIKPQRPSPVRSPGLNSHKVNAQLQQHLTRKQQMILRNKYKQTSFSQQQNSVNSSKNSEESCSFVKENKFTEIHSKSERKIDIQYLRKAAERMGEWDIDYVCKFLDHINCGQHKDVFRKNCISGDTLPFLKVELLVDLGLPFGNAYKVIARVHRLLGTYPNVLLAYHNAL